MRALPRAGLRLLEVLMTSGNMQPHVPEVLPYELWAVRFEEISIARLHASLPGIDGIVPGGVLSDGEDLLLDQLAPSFLFAESPDPVENPPVPASVGQVAAELKVATYLFAELFLALFDSDFAAEAYVVATGYDSDGDPELLAPFSVVVLSGAYGYQGRRVLYEGEWLLETLVVNDSDQLRDLHERLKATVEGEWLSGAA